VVVTDNVLGTVGTIPGVFAPNTTNFFFSTNIAVVASVTNLGVVSGTPAFSNGSPIPGVAGVQASDPAIVQVVTPSIRLVKTAGNAADGDILFVLPGSNVVYTYEVINTGNAYLTNVVVTDNLLGVVGTVPGVVAPGATNFLYKTNFNITAYVQNIAVSVGTPAFSNGAPIPGLGTVKHTDDAIVDVVRPGIFLLKTAGNAPTAGSSTSFRARTWSTRTRSSTPA